MPKITQTESGKAWEYGLARQCADVLNRKANLVVNSSLRKSQESYDLQSNTERGRIDKAANEVVVFLRAHDPRLVDTERVVMQSDMMGAQGDVRDLLIETPNAVIGISAKHRHTALKHSRLSDTNDFGKKWYDNPCSQRYWDAVAPVFAELRKRTGELWRELPNKHTDVYLPILDAFIQEAVDNANPERIMRYLLGRHDFYKVIKENGNVSLQSFNMSGMLRWGSRIPLPEQIIQLSMKPRSKTTAIMIMNRGWQVSFRIHNAESQIIPSLKFDVQLLGCPPALSRHQIPYG